MATVVLTTTKRNGDADDTAIIQAALTAASAADVVVVPSGPVKITAALNVKQNTTLKIMGPQIVGELTINAV